MSKSIVGTIIPKSAFNEADKTVKVTGQTYPYYFTVEKYIQKFEIVRITKDKHVIFRAQEAPLKAK